MDRQDTEDRRRHIQLVDPMVGRPVAPIMEQEVTTMAATILMAAIQEPATTQALLDTMAVAAVAVPTAWREHIEKDTYQD